MGIKYDKEKSVLAVSVASNAVLYSIDIIDFLTEVACNKEPTHSQRLSESRHAEWLVNKILGVSEKE